MDEVKNEKKIESVYLDGFTLNFGSYDFAILGTRKKKYINENGEVNEEQLLETDMRMSPQLAKALNKILSEAIFQYEEKFGKIPDVLNKIPVVQNNNEQ